MTQAVTCKSCQQSFAAPEHLLGQRLPCPNCQMPIDVPFPQTQLTGLQPVQPSIPSTSLTSSTTTSAIGRKVNNRFIIAIVFGVGIGLILLISVGTALILVWGRSRDVAETTLDQPVASSNPLNVPTVTRNPVVSPQQEKANKRTASESESLGNSLKFEVQEWFVQPDPLPVALQGANANIESVAIPFPANSDRGAIFPNYGGRYVAIREHTPKRGFADRVWDLQTQRPVGKAIMMKEVNRVAGLTMDGQYFVAALNPTDLTYEEASQRIDLGYDESVFIWRVSDGERLHEILDADSDYDSERAFHLTTDNKLVAYWDSGDRLVVYDLQSGKKELSMELSARTQAISVSPGGRYVVTVDSVVYAEIIVIDLRKKAVVGRIKCGRLVLSGPVFAFKPDGTQFVCFDFSLDNPKCYVFDVKTGRIVRIVELPEQIRYYSPSSNLDLVQWLQSDNGWMIASEAVLDLNSGQSVWERPKIFDKKFESRCLPDDRLILDDSRGQQRVMIALPLGLGQ